MSGFGGGLDAGARVFGPLGFGLQVNYSSLNDIVSSVIAIPSHLIEYYGKVFLQTDEGFGIGLLLGAGRYFGNGVLQSVNATNFSAGFSLFSDWVVGGMFSVTAGAEFKGIFPGGQPYIFANVLLGAKVWF